ncbi:MAG: hypothetical protein QXI10_03490 [Candidatus Diapherotrites archaeon]
MGVFDKLFGRKDAEKVSNDSNALGKYNEPCSLCGALGAEKKWAGKYWHVKCLRKGKKVAKGML